LIDISELVTITFSDCTQIFSNLVSSIVYKIRMCEIESKNQPFRKTTFDVITSLITAFNFVFVSSNFSRTKTSDGITNSWSFKLYHKWTWFKIFFYSATNYITKSLCSFIVLHWTNCINSESSSSGFRRVLFWVSGSMIMIVGCGCAAKLDNLRSISNSERKVNLI
jgi:hypothetical protein